MTEFDFAMMLIPECPEKPRYREKPRIHRTQKWIHIRTDSHWIKGLEAPKEEAKSIKFNHCPGPFVLEIEISFDVDSLQ